MIATFGGRLRFPRKFAGSGKMSRGGLLLRGARGGTELTYEPAGASTRRQRIQIAAVSAPPASHGFADGCQSSI